MKCTVIACLFVTLMFASMAFGRDLPMMQVYAGSGGSVAPPPVTHPMWLPTTHGAMYLW